MKRKTSQVCETCEVYYCYKDPDIASLIGIGSLHAFSFISF
ncbi:MAG: hypothetical protein R3214_14415 [Christiangramia sp.]|nr:hypothetical protein [Christiangramia sp.]